MEAPAISSEEFLEIRRALAASEAQIKHLVKSKEELEKKVSSFLCTSR